MKDRVDNRLVKNSLDYQNFLSKPIFVFQMIFNKKLIAVHKNKEVLTLNKPVYVGMYIRFE